MTPFSLLGHLKFVWGHFWPKIITKILLSFLLALYFFNTESRKRSRYFQHYYRFSGLGLTRLNILLHGKAKEGELRKEGDSTVDIKNEIAGKERKKGRKSYSYSNQRSCCLNIRYDKTFCLFRLHEWWYGLLRVLLFTVTCMLANRGFVLG